MPAPSVIPSGTGPPFFPWDVPFSAPPFQGRIASALPIGISWYVRVGGSNNNGGTDAALAALRTGTDGVTNSTTTFTSASAAFTQADVNRGICIGTGAARHHRIASVTNGTTVLLDRAATNSTSGQTWAIGGAWADPRVPMGAVATNVDNNSPVRSGDTCWIGAGTYRVIIGTAGTAWNPASGGQAMIVGDFDGSHTGDAGMVKITAYLTDDHTAPSAATLMGLRPNLYFSNIVFIGAAQTSQAGSCVDYTPPSSGPINVTFRDCAFIRSGGGTGAAVTQTLVRISVFAGQTLGFLMDRCYFVGHVVAQQGGLVTISLNRGAQEYDMGVTLQNSVFLNFGGAGALKIRSAGAGAGRPGGAIFRNNTVFGGVAVAYEDANSSTLLPTVVTGCALIGCTSALVANALGNIVESYNLIDAQTPRTLVSVGPGSISDGSYAFDFCFGQERIWGGAPRPFGEPVVGSTGFQLFGSPNTAAGLLDLRAGPRPALASQWMAGAIQRGNNFVKETGTVHTGSNAISVTGGGFQDFDLAVDAGALTVSAFGRYDSNYTGPLPQLQVVKGGQVGVGDVQVNFSTNALGAWEQQSITINPTASGIVTIRLVSGDTSTTGKTFFDTFSAA